MEILLNVGLSILGILLFTLVLSQKHIKDGTFDWSKFVRDNMVQWVWSIVAATLLSIVLHFVPDFRDQLSGIVGIDVDDSKGGFVLLGFVLSSLIRPSTK